MNQINADTTFLQFLEKPSVHRSQTSFTEKYQEYLD